jgi:hypothetical protein
MGPRMPVYFSCKKAAHSAGEAHKMHNKAETHLLSDLLSYHGRSPQGFCSTLLRHSIAPRTRTVNAFAGTLSENGRVCSRKGGGRQVDGGKGIVLSFEVLGCR